MDEQRLGELFRSAAAEAEPPGAGFGHDDVLAGSRRLARRQRVVVAAAVVAVAGLGVGAVVGGGLVGTGPASTLAEAPAAEDPAADSAARPLARPERPDPAGDAASGGAALESAPAPGSAPDGPVAPDPAPAPFAAPPGAVAQDAGPAERNKVAPGFAAGCARPDPEVFAQLTAVLPELRGRSPRPVPGGCGEGGIGVAVGASGGDGGVAGGAGGGVAGTLAVVIVPSGVPDTAPADSAVQRSEVLEARSGRILRLTVTAADGPPPYRDRLRELAEDLADRL